MAKVYFCKFTDKKTGKAFYKFGHTSKSDVLQRFSTFFDKRYAEFDIKVICSIKGELAWCQEIEEDFKAQYPKNIWLENYFADERKWDNFSGITEIVALCDDDYRSVTRAFYDIKETQEHEV